MKKFHQLLRTIKPRNERTGSLAIFNIGLKRLQIRTFTQKIEREKYYSLLYRKKIAE